MSIYQIKGNRLTATKITQTEHILRTGQIVQGRIIKLYPNNKAEIQLGSKRLIAQLEASLSVGERYHFQVQNTEDVIHLKVLGEQLKHHPRENITNLMQELGIRATKQNITFMQTLFSEKISFDRTQLLQAIKLLDNKADTKNIMQVLKDMVSLKLPITDSVFQALLTKNTTSLSGQMHAMLEQLKQAPDQSELHRALINRINGMMESPLDPKAIVNKQIIAEIATNSQQLFNLLKVAGIIDSTTDYALWKLQWESIARQKGLSDDLYQVNDKSLPRMHQSALIQSLVQINENKTVLVDHAQEIVNLFANKMNHAIGNNEQLSTQNFNELQKHIIQKLMPLLPEGHHQHLKTILQNNPGALHQLLQLLQIMNDDHTYSNLPKILNQINQDLSLSNPREQFLNLLKQTLLFTGLSYENQIANENAQQQSATMKSMLLQLLSQSNGALRENSQQLLHLINGMQIHSVNETNDFIQASLQIPGEKIGLPNDVGLEFEGPKTENGEINTDFCRILFYLELANLKRTIIDMNIQKRAVGITVYNDSEGLKDSSAGIQPMLKKGLEMLNYQLSSITFKPILTEDNPKNGIQNKFGQPSVHQGVDYRI